MSQGPVVGVCAPFVAANQFASVAPVFWSKQSALWAIDVVPASQTNGIDMIDIRSAETVRRALIDLDGGEHVVLQRSDQAVTLHAQESCLIAAPVAFSLLITGSHELRHAPRVLHRLNELIAPPTTNGASVRTAHQNYDRLRDALIGLDNDLAGMTYRTIAAVLFGERAAAEDWGGGQSTLKQRVRRTIKRGHNLSNGGYRRLLQV